MSNDPSEVPQQPRPFTFSYFIVLLFVVAPLWTFVPLSWAFVIYSLTDGKLLAYLWLERTCFVVAFCEVAFTLYHYRLARYVSSLPPNPASHPIEIRAAWTRLLKAGLANLPEDGFDEESTNSQRLGSPAETITQLDKDDPRAIDFRDTVRTWFCKVPWSALRLQQVHEWLYWSLYNTHMPPIDKMDPSHKVVLDEVVELFQKRAGATIRDGSDPSVSAMRLTIDKVNISWRPFAFYALLGLTNWGLRLWMQGNWDMVHGEFDGFEYLLRIPPRWNQYTGARPIVFVHGLGLGLLQYNALVRHMLETFHDRPLLIVLQPHISQDIFHSSFLKPMNRHQMSNSLASFLQKIGWVDRTEENSESSSESEGPGTFKTRKGVTVLSHSNGSYTHAWLLKEHPRMITRSCFVDPVTFCSWEGDVCYNFLYRPCRTGLELLMRYFVGTELGVANLLQRHFDWVSNSLWFEEIPNARDPSRTLFLLAGRDSILEADRIKRYLTSHGVRKGLWYDADARHGQALVAGGAGHTEVLRWLQESDN